MPHPRNHPRPRNHLCRPAISNAQAAIDAAQDGDSIGLLTGSVGTSRS